MEDSRQKLNRIRETEPSLDVIGPLGTLFSLIISGRCSCGARQCARFRVVCGMCAGRERVFMLGLSGHLVLSNLYVNMAVQQARGIRNKH